VLEGTLLLASLLKQGPLCSLNLRSTVLPVVELQEAGGSQVQPPSHTHNGLGNTNILHEWWGHHRGERHDLCQRATPKVVTLAFSA
jgi:hypothetical protein